jgi:uncharacterized membrane protein YcfT
MPLFFIVSGLLVARSLNKKGLGSYITGRINNILYPLIIWGGIQITLYLLTSGFTHNGVSSISYLYLIIDPRKTGHFWYLNALFCIGVIFAFLKSRLKVTPLLHTAIGFVLFCVSAYIHTNNLNAGALGDICEYYFFFALGDLISNRALAEKNMQSVTSWKVFFPLFIVFLISQYYCTGLNLNAIEGGKSNELYVEYKLPFLFLMEALFGVALTVNFSLLLEKYQKMNFLRIVGFHSLFIYCTHIIVMTIARTICTKMFHISNVPVLMISVWSSGVILPIIFYNFCLRYNLWWLFTFKKPKREVEYLQNNNIFGYSIKNRVKNEGSLANAEPETYTLPIT